MDDKFYTRIPNKDFDSKLTDTVSEKVDEYVKGKIALAGSIIAVISFLLGFLARYYFSESTRKQIEENVKKISEKISKDNEESQKKLDNLLNDQKEFITSNNHLNNDRITDLNRRFDNLRSMLDNQVQQASLSTNKNISDFQSNTNNRLKQVEEQLTKMVENTQVMVKAVQAAQENLEKVSSDKIDAKFSEAFDFLWADIISGMIDRAKDRGYKGQALIDDFQKLLKRELKITVDLQVKIIDTLMRCYYNTECIENGVDKRYDKMVALIRNYEDKYDLLAETYANAAIGLTNYYELFGTSDLLEAAIANCDKSIQRNRDYGLPYALKMELYSIASTKTREEELKAGYKEEIESLLYLIDRIPSALLKGEFLERLHMDKQLPYLKYHIEQLYLNYAKELTPFRENVIEDLIKNYSRATEYEKKLYLDLLDEGLVVHPNLDDEWKAISYIKGGAVVDLNNNETILTLKASSYLITSSNGYFDQGVIYFLPHLVPYSFLMVATEAKDNFKTVKGIYKLDSTANELTWCVAAEQKERPADFSSTAENDFSIITFSRQ